MVKKNNYFTCFIFFYSFTSLVCGEKNILPRSGAGRSRVFLAPWSRSRSKKNTRSQSRSRSRLGKKSGAGAGWKKVSSRSWSRSRKKICRLPSPGSKYVILNNKIFTGAICCKNMSWLRDFSLQILIKAQHYHLCNEQNIKGFKNNSCSTEKNLFW